jgi:hypothetical protein
VPRRFSIVFTLVALAGLLLAACAVQQEQPKEEAAEEAGVEEKAPKEQPKEKAQGESAFVGEHENLKPGDTAEWNAGMTITVEDAYIAPNERRRAAEERQASREAKAKEGRKVREDPKGKTEPALDEPEQLIGLSWTLANEGEVPINFNNALPCTALDANGVQLSRSAGSTAEQMDDPGASLRALQQPLEQGQVRSGITSIPIRGVSSLRRSALAPENGPAEFVCAYPPQQGGAPNIAQIPEAGRATWILDPAELEVRE